MRNHRWYSAACWSALISLALFFAIDGNIVARAIFCTLAWALVTFFFVGWWRSSPITTHLDYYREQLGGDGPFLCEVEIGPEGIVTKQFGAEVRRAWSGVKEIRDTLGSIDIVWRTGGILVVRDRAFETPEARASFLQSCRILIATGQDNHASAS